MKPIFFFVLILSTLGLNSILENPEKGKTSKGFFYEGAELTASREAAEHCAVDSGSGFVIYVTEEYENDLFQAGAKSIIHLKISFPDMPKEKEAISMKDPGVVVCYREVGDLLLFESFEGSGYIWFDEISEKKVTGKMDMKIVNPHHNMSNADYHYMGNGFKLKPAEIKAE